MTKKELYAFLMKNGFEEDNNEEYGWHYISFRTKGGSLFFDWNDEDFNTLYIWSGLGDHESYGYDILIESLDQLSTLLKLLGVKLEYYPIYLQGVYAGMGKVGDLIKPLENIDWRNPNET